MMYLGFSLEYDEISKGSATACRMIGDDIIETTLSDYCNSADKKNPIITVVGYTPPDRLVGPVTITSEYIKVYTNQPNCDIKYINVKYIKTPNIVKYDLNPNECVNCDLPEYCHFEIVENAVQKYNISVKQNNVSVNSK